MQVPIDPTKITEQFPSKSLVVAIELLMFYQLMGIMHFKCTGGCVCMVGNHFTASVCSMPVCPAMVSSSLLVSCP